MRTIWTILMLALGAQSAGAEPRLVRIAVDEAYPPYSYAEQGKAQGLYIQLLERALVEMPQWRVKWLPMPWPRALRQTEMGSVDALLPPYKQLARTWMTRYVGPVYDEEVVLYCDTRSGLKPGSKWPKDFAGRKLGTMRGYLLGRNWESAVQQQVFQRQDFVDGRDALAALAMREVDCYANDRLSIEQVLAQARRDPLWGKRMPEQLVVAHVLSVQAAYVGISSATLKRRPELAEFAQELDAKLAELRASKEMDKLVRGLK